MTQPLLFNWSVQGCTRTKISIFVYAALLHTFQAIEDFFFLLFLLQRNRMSTALNIVRQLPIS